MTYSVEWIGVAFPVALVVFLATPWLSLIVLIAVLMVAVAALVALATAVVGVPYRLARHVHRLWLARSAKEQRPALHVPPAPHAGGSRLSGPPVR